MSITKILHDTAMEFYDQAKLCKIKGEQSEHDALLKKAYLMEREAALKMPSEEKDNYWQYMLVRSSAWLAYHCGEYEQALQLVYWGLSESPPVYEKNHLENLLEALKPLLKNKKHDVQKSKSTNFYGILSSVDVDTGKITIRSIENNQSDVITTSKTIMQKTIRHLIGEVVNIEAQMMNSGELLIKNIKTIN